MRAFLRWVAYRRAVARGIGAAVARGEKMYPSRLAVIKETARMEARIRQPGR